MSHYPLINPFDYEMVVNYENRNETFNKYIDEHVHADVLTEMARQSTVFNAAVEHGMDPIRANHVSLDPNGRPNLPTIPHGIDPMMVTCNRTYDTVVYTTDNLVLVAAMCNTMMTPTRAELRKLKRDANKIQRRRYNQ